MIIIKLFNKYTCYWKRQHLELNKSQEWGGRFQSSPIC